MPIKYVRSLYQPKVCFDAPNAGGGGNTVLVDQATFVSQGSPSSTSFNIGAGILNIGGGPNGTANRALLVSMHFVQNPSGTSTSPTVIWDQPTTNQSMTLITGGHVGNGTGGEIYLFGLINPTLGSKNINCTWSGANQCQIWAMSVVGADQTGGATTFTAVNTATGTGSPNTITISGATGQLSYAAHNADANFIASGGSGVTDIAFADTGNQDSGAANYGLGTITPTYSFSGGSGAWCSVGCAIKAV